MTKVLIDTNICIDAALSRTPFATLAHEIIQRSEWEHFEGMVSGHSFDTMFYILRKKKSMAEVYNLLDDYRLAFGVSPVTQSVIDTALNLKWSDFEDAIHYQAAKSAGCQAIITRNKKDFKDADISVLSPVEFLAELS